VNVAGLLLAAGEGRRFGGPKAEVELAGERLVDIGVRILAEGGCAPIVVVSGAAQLVVPGAEVVPNPDWASGIGSSLRTGLAALTAVRAEAVVTLLVDTPWVSAAAVRRLVASAREVPAAVATYDGRRGHPVLLDAVVWREVSDLAVGDVGAKAWMKAHPDEVLEVDCTGLGDPRDVDHPQDLQPQPDRPDLRERPHQP
jgi:nicotine blue oxidoreductase